MLPHFHLMHLHLFWEIVIAVLHTHYHYVDCPSRKNKTLDMCCGSVKNAYTAVLLPPLGTSDHSVVYIHPVYRRLLNREKPKKTVEQWHYNGSVGMLRLHILGGLYRVFFHQYSHTCLNTMSTSFKTLSTVCFIKTHLSTLATTMSHTSPKSDLHYHDYSIQYAFIQWTTNTQNLVFCIAKNIHYIIFFFILYFGIVYCCIAK